MSRDPLLQMTAVREYHVRSLRRHNKLVVLPQLTLIWTLKLHEVGQRWGARCCVDGMIYKLNSVRIRRFIVEVRLASQILPLANGSKFLNDTE